MTNNEMLDQLQDHFGFDNFVVIGTIEAEDETASDQLHVISNGALDPISVVWLCIEAMQFMLLRSEEMNAPTIQ